MLHLFDDLWLDKIIPKNNDGGRAIYGNLENKMRDCRPSPYNLSLYSIFLFFLFNVELDLHELVHSIVVHIDITHVVY
jgi:hypothetical protein